MKVVLPNSSADVIEIFDDPLASRLLLPYHGTIRYVNSVLLSAYTISMYIFYTYELPATVPTGEDVPVSSVRKFCTENVSVVVACFINDTLGAGSRPRIIIYAIPSLFQQFSTPRFIAFR